MKFGLLSERINRRSVFKNLTRNIREEVIAGAGSGEDCAVLALKDTHVACAVSSFTVFSKEAGRLAVFEAVGKVNTKGAEAVSATVSLILPENFEEGDLRFITSDIDRTCKELAVQVAGFDTQVSGDVSRAIVTVAVTGYVNETAKPAGSEPGDKEKSTKSEHGNEDGGSSEAPSADSLVITGHVALSSTVILANKCENRLHERYSTSFIDDAKNFDRLLDVRTGTGCAQESGVKDMLLIGEGGVFTALWKIAEKHSSGLRVDLKKIPIKQETVEICNELDINPYLARSGGAVIMLTDSPDRLIEELYEAGIPAVCVGELTSGKDRVIINDDETRFLDLPGGDALNEFWASGAD